MTYALQHIEDDWRTIAVSDDKEELEDLVNCDDIEAYEFRIVEYKGEQINHAMLQSILSRGLVAQDDCLNCFFSVDTSTSIVSVYGYKCSGTEGGMCTIPCMPDREVIVRVCYSPPITDIVQADDVPSSIDYCDGYYVRCILRGGNIVHTEVL